MSGQKTGLQEKGLTEKEVCAATELLPTRRVKFGMSVVPSSELSLSSWKTESNNHLLLRCEQTEYIPKSPTPRLRFDGLEMVTSVPNDSASCEPPRTSTLSILTSP